MNGKKAGTYSDISCFSFYPTKPLGAFGDAGMALTNDDELNEKLHMLRFYGSRVKYVSEITGVNTRMDEVQAAILSVGLKHLEESTARRVEIAKKYLEGIKNPKIKLPEVREGCAHVYHIFGILCEQRDELLKFLEDRGVQGGIHYPIPPHLAPCYAYMGFKQGDFPITEKFAAQQLSLPIYMGMPDEEVDYVIDMINSF